MASAMLLSSAALAADLPARMAAPPPAPAVFVMQPWNGFYAGSGIGYMWTRATTRQGGTTRSYDLDGTTSSSIVGRDWQFGNVVAGLQGEIGFHETKGSFGTAATLGVQGDHLWSAGIKGRLGYAIGSVLPFVTLGIAGTEYNQHSLVVNQDSDVARHLGFTAGAGVEIAWNISWLRGFATRFEYEYADYGRETYRHDGANHSVDLSTHVVKATAVFREMPASLPAGTLAPGRGGSYAGVLVGYGFGDATFRRPAGARTGLDFDGAEVGLFSGYDLSLGNWFVGYDSHVLGSGLDGRGTGAAGPIALDMLWTGSTRARIGTTFGAFSPYIAGGFTLAQLNVVSAATGQQDAEMAYGGIGGVGVDYAITDRWFARAEYSYSRYAKVEPRVDAAVNRLELDRHDVRFGLGYRLGD